MSSQFVYTPGGLSRSAKLYAFAGLPIRSAKCKHQMPESEIDPEPSPDVRTEGGVGFRVALENCLWAEIL